MRRVIIGLAVGCYAAAVMIAVAAVRLPAPRQPALVPLPERTAAEAPPSSAPEPDQTIAEDTPATPPPPERSPDENHPTEEDALLERAEAYQQAGDLKQTEAIYLMLLGREEYRSAAAQKLGKLYFNAGDYARAGEMYRESARSLRETQKAAP